MTNKIKLIDFGRLSLPRRDLNMTKKEMPLSATRNYPPIGVMVVVVVIIVPPKIVTYDKPAPTIVVVEQIVDMLLS